MSMQASGWTCPLCGFKNGDFKIVGWNPMLLECPHCTYEFEAE